MKAFSEEDAGLFQERFTEDTIFYEAEKHEHEVDACVAYGGDGTLLLTANKF